jgi:hypothetical protein
MLAPLKRAFRDFLRMWLIFVLIQEGILHCLYQARDTNTFSSSKKMGKIYCFFQHKKQQISPLSPIFHEKAKKHPKNTLKCPFGVKKSGKKVGMQ